MGKGVRRKDVVEDKVGSVGDVLKNELIVSVW